MDGNESPQSIQSPTAPRDWVTGHPDSPQVKEAAVARILAVWREAWAA